MNWFIGQNIVAIRTQYNRMFKEGDVFEIQALRKANCNCYGGADIDIGQRIPIDFVSYCEHCGCKSKCDGIAWHDGDYFRPLDELTDITALTEILEQPVESLFKAK